MVLYLKKMMQKQRRLLNMNKHSFSYISQNISESVTVGLADRVSLLKKQGFDVVALNEGELDFDTPIEIVNGAKDALGKGLTKYSWLNGEPPLKELICEKLWNENSIKSSPNQILITNGSKQVILEIVLTLVGKGDEVIVPVPCWATYVECIKLAGGTPVLVSCLGSDLDVQAIQQAVTDKTKLIIINTPNNPTGAVYSAESLRELLKFLQAKRIFVLSDEAYERIVFTGAEHVSLATIWNSEYIITVQSFSKAFSMTGFRVGYASANEEIIDRISALHAHMTDNVCTFAQYGAIAALSMDQTIFRQRLQQLEQRRDFAFNIVDRVFDCVKPRGAFYFFPSVAKYLGSEFSSSADLCRYLLDTAGVALIPGEACMMPGHVRISFAASSNDLEIGLERISKALNGIKGK